MKNIIKDKIREFYNSEEIKYLLKNSKFKVVYEILLFLISFFTSWCFANFTPAEFYGTYLFILSIISFFTFLSFVGINQALIQYVVRGYDYFLITSIKKRFYFSVLGTLAIIVYTILYKIYFELNVVILISLLIGALFFPIIHSLYSIFFFLDGKAEFKKDLIYKTTNLIILNIFLLILIFLTKNIILHFILLNITHLIVNGLFFRQCIKLIENKNKNVKLEKEALKFGFFLTKYGLITLITFNINNLIIGLIFGPNILASYIVGNGLSITIISFLKPSLSVLLTKYSKQESKISRKFITFLIIGSIILFFGTVLAIPFYIRLFFPKYLDSIKYGTVYSLIILLYPIEVVLGFYFRGKIMKKVIRNAFIIPDILNLITIIPFLLLFGIYGLIFGEIIKHLFRLIIYIANKSKIDFK